MQFGATAESSIARLRVDQSETVPVKPSLTAGAVGAGVRSTSHHMRRTSSASGLGYQPPSKVCTLLLHMSIFVIILSFKF